MITITFNIYANSVKNLHKFLLDLSKIIKKHALIETQ